MLKRHQIESLYSRDRIPREVCKNTVRSDYLLMEFALIVTKEVHLKKDKCELKREK